MEGGKSSLGAHFVNVRSDMREDEMVVLVPVM